MAIFDLNAERGEDVALELGGVFCRVDISSEESVDAGFVKARAAHGQERVLINCAGGGKNGKTASRDKTTGATKHYLIEDFSRVVQLNLVGTFRCIAKSAQGMLDLEPLEDGERGAIVNTASVAARDGQVGQVSYSASKAGIVGMTLTIARDLMNDGVRINTIMPGIMNTPPMNRVDPKVKAVLEMSVPFPKRMGHAQEFAQLALTMVTNSYFNGESVRLDGAIRMPPR